MWQWECWSAVEQYKGMCLRYSQWSGWESREESKKTMDYTGNPHQNGWKKEMEECQHRRRQEELPEAKKRIEKSHR